LIWLVVLGWLKRIPWQVYVILALLSITAVLRWYWIGVGVERCQSAQVAAQAKAVAKGQKASEKAHKAATAVKIDVRQESENEAAEVREVVRGLPRTCPPIPDRVRQLGRDAAEAARASVPAAP
jgi:hypothetical protein